MTVENDAGFRVDNRKVSIGRSDWFNRPVPHTAESEVDFIATRVLQMINLEEAPTPEQAVLGPAATIANDPQI